MKVCSLLRSYCLRNQVAADVSVGAGISLLLASVWGTLQYSEVMLAWVAASVFPNGMIFATGIIVDAFLVTALICLGSSDCSIEQLHRRTYRGGQTPVTPASWPANLAKNPLRASL